MKCGMSNTRVVKNHLNLSGRDWPLTCSLPHMSAVSAAVASIMTMFTEANEENNVMVS